MPTRHRFKHQTTLQHWITGWTVGMREQAPVLEPARERPELLKKRGQAETAMHLQDWASSPGLQPPK